MTAFDWAQAHPYLSQFDFFMAWMAVNMLGGRLAQGKLAKKAKEDPRAH
jgi:hypothetical protein